MSGGDPDDDNSTGQSREPVIFMLGDDDYRSDEPMERASVEEAGGGGADGDHSAAPAAETAAEPVALPAAEPLPDGSLLGRELDALAARLAPTREEAAARSQLVARVRSVVQRVYPSAETVVFGSQATDMCVPQSDLDVTVIQGESAARAIRRLAGGVHRSQLFQNVVVLAHAKVPIIKMVDKTTGLAVDISFNRRESLRNVKFVRKLADELPSLRPLCRIVKYQLARHGLNDPAYGGLGSYSLVLMLAYSLRYLTPPSASMADQFVRFLTYFGRDFDFRTRGICITSVDTIAKEDFPGKRIAPDTLLVRDPIDATNNTGRPTQRYWAIASLFARISDKIAAGAGIDGHKRKRSDSGGLAEALPFDEADIRRRRKRMCGSGDRRKKSKGPGRRGAGQGDQRGANGGPQKKRKRKRVGDKKGSS